MRGIVLLVLAATAAADYDETEHRLKTAGVGPALRAKIHASIDKGVAYLISRQHTDGSFEGDGAMPGYPATRSGYTALCALALRHAGTPPARRAARDAIRYLFPPGSQGRKALWREVYTAGLSLMLLAADRSHGAEGRDLALALAAGQLTDRWWGYHLRSDQGPFLSRFGNLSTTQFAALGLWSGARLEAEIPRIVWMRHLESLLNYQTLDGSWPYAAKMGIDYGYSTGTFMGLANVELALGALGRRPDPDVSIETLKVHAEKARAAGRNALDRDGARMLFDFRRRRLRDYYALYALEKACLFADRTHVGGVPWYAFGAEMLVGMQKDTGVWPLPPQDSRGSMASLQRRLTTTSFALLFLLRSSRTYHPTTPRRPDLRPGPITGKPPAPEPPPPAPPPAPVPEPVPLAEARVRLLALETYLADRDVANDELLGALRDVGAAYGRVRPDDGDWRDDAHALLLRAVALVKAKKLANTREPVNILAAELLARAPATTSPDLLLVLDKTFRRPRGFRPGNACFRAIFDALAAQGHPDAAPWLVTRILDADFREERLARTQAALEALFAIRLPEGRVRHDAVKRIVRLFHEIERSAEGIMSGKEARAAAGYWNRMRIPVLKVLDRYTRDRTGAAARGPEGRWLARVADYEPWLKSHANPRDPPWD